MSARFCPVSDDPSLRDGLNILQESRPADLGPGGTPVVFEGSRPRPGFSIEARPAGWLVKYESPCDAFRALGLILGHDGKFPEGFPLTQDRAFATVGMMWDLSRNAVLRVEAVKELFRAWALMGYNAVQLYMEDVYALPGEEFFGYARGVYTPEELREIDAYGHALGLEVMPCIQTLGHLEQILQWPPYRGLKDVTGVLMVGEEATYRLIAKMLDTLTGCFRSRRIHIGMDEAHGVGTGAYLRKHGPRRPFDILNEHLRRVTALCRERGLRPMIWSDMYFRIGSKTNDYYDREAEIPAEVASAISPEVDLVYWDYYHEDPGFYEEWIRRHRTMGKEPILATAAWSWGRFWTLWCRWRECVSAGMTAARRQDLREVFLTVWGDDGNEHHPFSVLPAAQYFAEWAYVGEPADAALERQFAVFSSDTTLADCRLASRLDEVPAVEGRPIVDSNFSKWILWHDPVLGFLNRHILPDLPEHYRNLTETLQARTREDPGPLRFPLLIARALALKSALHLNVRPACEAKDLARVRHFLEEEIPATQDAVRTLWEYHREVWHQWHKPFGWEVLERRYGGLLARLESLRHVLERFLKDPERKVPEFSFRPQEIQAAHEPQHFYFSHAAAATPSAIK